MWLNYQLLFGKDHTRLERSAGMEHGLIMKTLMLNHEALFLANLFMHSTFSEINLVWRIQTLLVSFKIYLPGFFLHESFATNVIAVMLYAH